VSYRHFDFTYVRCPNSLWHYNTNQIRFTTIIIQAPKCENFHHSKCQQLHDTGISNVAFQLQHIAFPQSIGQPCNAEEWEQISGFWLQNSKDVSCHLVITFPKTHYITLHQNQTVNDRVAHSKNPRKCAYLVTFDLDLEHTLDAGLPGDHRVQVWCLVPILPFAWEKKRFSCQHKSACITWPLTLTLSTPWMHADLESILWKFGSDPAICLREEAICAKVYRRTDGQTDRRRTPRHCISSFLEWANKTT